MPFEPFDEATGFGAGEGFVERRGRARVEIVLNQDDFVRVEGRLGSRGLW